MKSYLPPASFAPAPFDCLPAAKAPLRNYQRKQTVFHQGAEPKALFHVVSGTVILERHTEAGQKVILHRAGAGDLIAEASLFSQTYHCDCVTQVDATLIALDKPAVLQLMATDPDFASALVKKMSRQVQRYRRQLELRSIFPAVDRVLAGLSDGWLTGSVMQFASDIGLSHEATYRALATLVASGKIRKTGRGQYLTRFGQ